MSASGHFFHARQSSEVLSDKVVIQKPRSSRSSKRAALSERSQSEINQDLREHPTIRLVDHDSSSPTTVYDQTPFPRLPSQVLKPPRTTKHGYTIQNDGQSTSLDARIRDRSSSPKRSSKLFPQLHLGKSNRISTSTTTSNAETLFNDSLYSPTNNRFSTEGTLRNTPTPGLQDWEERDRERTNALEALEEQVQEGPSTIRPVTASSATSSASDRVANFRESTHQAFDRSIHPAFRQSAPIQQRTGRLSSIEDIETPGGSSPKDPSSEYSLQHSSSPPSHTRSNSFNIISYAASEDSEPVQFPQLRPPTALSQSADSWTTTESDSLPPLNVPRKRQHMHSASAGPSMHPGNRPLSTIASESERSSWTPTRNQMSFSSADMLRASSHGRHRRVHTLGSSSYRSRSSSRSIGQALSDVEDSQMELTHFSMMRAESAVPVPLFSSNNNLPVYELPAVSSPKEASEEQDDTIAELQAPPLRTQRSNYGLNRRRSISDPPPGSSRSNQTGTETTTDRTSQGSTIFPAWARQFYRGRAQLASANASKASLSRPNSQAFSTRSPVRMMPWMHHRRFESGWESFATGDTGFTNSRPGTARSGGNSVYNSSHFLPSIFRPQTRQRAYTDITAASRSDDYYEEDVSEVGSSGESVSRRNSMEITPAPPRPGDTYAAHSPSPLGSSELRPGKPRDASQSKKLKRKQRQRDYSQRVTSAATRNTTATATTASNGRPQLRPFETTPRLAPSRRLSHSRMSAWRAPSFNEALSTLIKTRQNRQILLFCLGFLCPVLWLVAAFLPIPPRPQMYLDDDNAEDAEAQMKMGQQQGGGDQTQGRYGLGVSMEVFDWEAETRWLKARWWRNLNRVMSFVGVGVIVAIIVLAVLAAK
ncbi:hypothetical protein AAFC00_005272 [Neodothiora populina]|uniref:Serine-rich protein n=1 Tax=Neodothiora populina TaxID=2781224 RepID=A0ABR3PKC6_9PEZI